MDAKIIGNVMPVLEVALNRGEPLIAESGDPSWMTESIRLRTSTRMAGATGIFGTLKRMAAVGLFMTEYCAHDLPGRSAFAAKLPHWPVVDCSDSPTAAMTQDNLRPCLTNAASCLQAARMLGETPVLGALGRGGVRDEGVRRDSWRLLQGRRRDRSP